MEQLVYKFDITFVNAFHSSKKTQKNCEVLQTCFKKFSFERGDETLFPAS